MTARWHVDHTFTGTDIEHFVDVYYSEAFNNAVAPISGLKERTLVEHETDDDGKVRRRVRMAPTIQLPKALKKLVGDREITYAEVSTYDPATRTSEFFVDHGMRDRLEVKGTIRFIETGGGVRRVIDGEVHAKVFGLAKIIERLIETETVKAYAKINAFMQRWLDDHPADAT
jgi:hypothetical protein